jgi:hypothetical protein
MVQTIDKLAEAKAWREKEFLPWKDAMAKYLDERGQQMTKLKAHAGDLQTIVALLIEGRTRQALLAWNTLGLHPHLKDLRVSGESLTLVGIDGTPTVLTLDDMIADLQGLLKG